MGCATGTYLETFGPESVGVDLSVVGLDACRAKGLRVIAADISRQLPFADREFEPVLRSRVLEHVDAPTALLGEMCRVLRPGGHVVIRLPTETSVVRAVNDAYFGSHEGHLYGFSLDCISRLLDRSTLAICET